MKSDPNSGCRSAGNEKSILLYGDQSVGIPESKEIKKPFT